MKQNYIIIILIFLIFILIYINPLVLWNIKKYLFISSVNNLTINNLQILQQENIILKNKLNQLHLLNEFLPATNLVQTAFVYSKYPFNLKNELLIKLPKENIAVGQGVVLLNDLKEKNFILIGKIKEIDNNFAVVQTIFDPDFKLSVKIGEKFLNGLFVGGQNPKIILIPRDAQINQNDIIINADSNLSYGLIIGLIGKIEEQPNTLFKEAEVIFPYDFNQINVVGIVK